MYGYTFFSVIYVCVYNECTLQLLTVNIDCVMCMTSVCVIIGLYS